MKDRMNGILQQVRSGQVRKARKSSIVRPPLISMSIFRNSEKNRQIRGHPGGVRWWKNWLRGPQSICWPVLDENLKERFSKERPTPNTERGSKSCQPVRLSQSKTAISIILYLLNWTIISGSIKWIFFEERTTTEP
jgi:hypothetical protein